jgi:S-adenosylmethionine-diacylglycerol 3-amino-3-carboxypropyl transferase
MLPLVHNRDDVARLLGGGPLAWRRDFYAQRWDTWRWRLLFQVFFSRAVMSRLGRDPSFFSYVEGSVASRILERTRHALTELDPAENPYISWILTGRHPRALPYALRPEHFETIRANLDRLEWHQEALEDYLTHVDAASFHRFNLSDVFEYMALERYAATLRQLAHAGTPGARLVYWNMLVPRSRPTELADVLRLLDELAAQLHRVDKAFFYRSLVIEEVL